MASRSLLVKKTTLTITKYVLLFQPASLLREKIYRDATFLVPTTHCRGMLVGTKLLEPCGDKFSHLKFRDEGSGLEV